MYLCMRLSDPSRHDLTKPHESSFVPYVLSEIIQKPSPLTNSRTAGVPGCPPFCSPLCSVNAALFDNKSRSLA